MSITEKVAEKYRQYGLVGVLVSVLRRIFVMPIMYSHLAYMIKHKRIMHYIRKRYAYVIQRYKDYAPPPSTPNCLPEYSSVIWSAWWQGEENAPQTVKLCLASIRKHCGSHKLVIITKDNYQDFVTIPEHIIAKVKSGCISLTHLSDIIRVNLLAKYGGLWLDSTIFVAEDIPEEIFSAEYYSIKYCAKPNYRSSNIAWGRWAIYCLGARDRNNLLFTFMSELFTEYLKDHDKFINYFLTDYLLAVAFEEFPAFRQACNKIPVNNTESVRMQFHYSNQEWDAEKYSKLTSTTIFFKMTYKKNFLVRTDDGKETFYGHLLAEYGMTE